MLTIAKVKIKFLYTIKGVYKPDKTSYLKTLFTPIRAREAKHKCYIKSIS